MIAMNEYPSHLSDYEDTRPFMRLTGPFFQSLGREGEEFLLKVSFPLEINGRLVARRCVVLRVLPEDLPMVHEDSEPTSVRVKAIPPMKLEDIIHMASLDKPVKDVFIEAFVSGIKYAYAILNQE